MILKPSSERYVSVDLERPHRSDGRRMLTVYLFLLLAVPSNLTIAPLGSYGRPAALWGLVLFGWWLLVRLQARYPLGAACRQPVRYAVAVFGVVVLLSLAVALLRGQPSDQISPAVFGLVRVVSWTGVFFVALDGLQDRNDLIIFARRIVIGSSILAALGLIQFVTARSWFEWLADVPGLRFDLGGVDARGGYVRASGTATHPLEFVTLLAGSLPLALAMAVSGGLKLGGRSSLRWWLPALLMAAASLVAVSRSAIVGLAVAVLGFLPAIPRRMRYLVVGGLLLLSLMVAIVVPGIFGAVMDLFSEVGGDSSTQSRSGALERLPGFMTSPWIGLGFGTFLPRYYIFDNQWAMVLVELGICGLVAFGAIALSAIWSAANAARTTIDARAALLARSLAAAVLTVSVLFAFFDGLSFPIAGGLFFLLAGMCGAIRGTESAAGELPSSPRKD